MSERLSSAVLALVFFVFLTTALFAEVVLDGAALPGPDELHSQALVAPLRPAGATRDDPPLWAAHLFAGMPTEGSLLFTPDAYLPERLLDWTGLRWTVFMVLHLAVAGLGTFCAARALGAAPLPALLSGVSFAFAPYLVVLADVGHGSQLITASWIPFTFFAVQRLLARRDLASLAGGALVLGLLLQGRHVQIAYYGLALAGGLWAVALGGALWRGQRREGLRATAAFAAALLLAALLSARLTLPVLEYLPYSIRGAPSLLEPAPVGGVGIEYATQWSLPPREALTYVLPALFGLGGATYRGGLPFTDFPNYVGLLPLVWAGVGLVLRVPGATGLATLGFMALLLSFGRHAWPVYAAAYHALPFFDAFRVPAMVLVLLNLAIALLAGLGLNGAGRRLAAATPGCRRRVARFAFAAAAGVALFAALAPGRLGPWLAEAGTAQRDMLRLDLVVATSLLLAGLIGLGFAARRAAGPAFLAALTLALTIPDLWRVDRALLHPAPPEAVRAYLDADDVARFLLADSAPRFRILPLGELFGHTGWAAHGIESVGGYHAAKPRAYQDLLQASGLATWFLDPAEPRRPLGLLDLLNVKYVLSLAPLEAASLELRTHVTLGSRRVAIYENRSVLPRPFLVGSYEVQLDPRRALERLLSPDFDPRRSVLLERAPAFEPAPDPEARIEVEEAGPDRLVVRTHSAAAQLLVLSDNHLPPLWSARVDGEAAPILRADFAFRALAVPGGSHRVEWLAHSRARRVGRALTQAGTLGVLGLLAGAALARVAGRGRPPTC